MTEYSLEDYKEAVLSMTYNNKIKNASKKDFDFLIDEAVKAGDEDVFMEAIKPYFSKFELNRISARFNEPVIEKPEEIALSDMLKEVKLYAVMDETSEKNPYLIKELFKTGQNGVYRILKKESVLSLAAYVESKLGVVIDVKDAQNIPAATPIFDPVEELFFQRDGIDYFNTWTEPALLCVDPEDEPEKPKGLEILEAIMLNLFGTPEGVNYAMNVLAYAYQFKASMPIILTIASIQGSGKGLLEILLKTIFTEAHYGVGAGNKNIFETSDNKELKDKIIYHLDEALIGGDLYEMAKRYAGNNSFVLKELYQNARTYPNRAIFINTFNLNREDEVRFTIAEDDRRLSLFKTFTKAIDLPGFKESSMTFDEIGLLFKSGDLPAYFAWQLASTNVDHNLISKPFDTEARQAWIDAGKDHTSDYYNAIKNRDIAYFERVADGVVVDGKYGIADTIAKMFVGEQGFKLRMTNISQYYKAIFGEEENKKKRDEIMKGLKTRDGMAGSYYYKIDEPTHMRLNTPQEPQAPKPRVVI